jgi:hypothetical protein
MIITPLAYIDPGSGMLIWQSITASMIGAGFYFRRFLMKVLRRGGSEKDGQLPNA